MVWADGEVQHLQAGPVVPGGAVLADAQLAADAVVAVDRVVCEVEGVEVGLAFQDRVFQVLPASVLSISPRWGGSSLVAGWPLARKVFGPATVNPMKSSSLSPTRWGLPASSGVKRPS
ncbi:hypothetical protein AB0P36_31575 [Streptomyces flavidovirens]|uniref:hypothetical protein n=1 Tax=Streptomyces flavidovirens TaxID=67298 RepID=UPI003428E386